MEEYLGPLKYFYFSLVVAIKNLFSIFWGVIIYFFPGAEDLALKMWAEFPNVLTYSLAISAYGIYVHKFYKTLAQRDIFPLDLHKYRKETDLDRFHKFLDTVSYFLKYTVFFPVYTSLWYFTLAIFLFTLSENQDVNTILFISISIVSATRITAYYSESLAQDIAKLLPFVLLGVYLVDPSFVSIYRVLLRINQGLMDIEKNIVYILFSVFLEWGLRLIWVFMGIFRND